MEDCRDINIGSINIAFDIWELSVLPMLLHNSECWMRISKKTLKILSDLFLLFFRTIFRIGSGCPIVNFYWQSGSLKVEHLILQKKMLFFHHLTNLPLNALAKNVLDLMENNDLPGLATEFKEHVANLKVIDVQQVTKREWKRKVYAYVSNLTKTELLEDAKKYKKISYEELSEEPFERKEFFNALDLEGARLKFRISSHMVDSVRSHFPSKYRARNKPLSCPSCSNNHISDDEKPDEDDLRNSPRDDLNHIMTKCIKYEEMRINRDIFSSDSDLVDFFKDVLEYRQKNNED